MRFSGVQIRKSPNQGNCDSASKGKISHSRISSAMALFSLRGFHRGLLLLFLFLNSLSVSSQAQTLLQSGPMMGYCEMREVMLWVQTKSEAKVKFIWGPSGQSQTENSSEEIMTRAADAFTAHYLITGLEPGTTYDYKLYLNDAEIKFDWPLQFTTQPLWQYRTDPPEIHFAIGSCAFIAEEKYDRPGDPYGSDYQIFNSIAAKNPDFMVWLGDNVYLREVDFSGKASILHRYTHTRSIPEMQKLLSTTHHYAIWDDHDYGPNDADESFIRKEETLDAFKLFWGNPTYGLKDHAGITTMFTWGDIDFFMLDNRWFRNSNERKTGDKTMIGDLQFNWLLDALKFSRAPFKFICIGGQVLNPEEKNETYANYFPEERKKLIDAIQAEKIKGVVFLNGDKHNTSLSKIKPDDGHTIWDLTCSPLTSKAYDASQEKNTTLVEGTFVGKKNFAMLSVTGAKNERTLSIEVFDSDGKSVWKKELKND